MEYLQKSLGLTSGKHQCHIQVYMHRQGIVNMCRTPERMPLKCNHKATMLTGAGFSVVVTVTVTVTVA